MFERKNVLSWDSYFMNIAKLSSLRSKDPNKQVGCCIVSKDNNIISTGYNGFPKGVSDKDFNWSRDDFGCGTKYDWVVHAELNAILNSNTKSLQDAKLYTVLLPCLECAKAIVQSGIKEVYYLDEFASGEFKFDLTKKLFNTVGIKLIKLEDINCE